MIRCCCCRHRVLPVVTPCGACYITGRPHSCKIMLYLTREITCTFCIIQINNFIVKYILFNAVNISGISPAHPHSVTKRNSRRTRIKLKSVVEILFPVQMFASPLSAGLLSLKLNLDRTCYLLDLTLDT